MATPLKGEDSAVEAVPQYLAVACVLRPHGRKGEVAAEVLTDFPERFGHPQEMYLESTDSLPRPAFLENAWTHKGRIILKFSGIDSIEQAGRLRGIHVLIRGESRVPLPPHRYYVWQLKGCRVVRDRGDGLTPEIEIGRVTDVEGGSGGVDLLRVALHGSNSGEALIPLVQSICKRIDIKAKLISIDAPEDLLELNQP